MKIVDRKTFLAMPVGTVFAKYQPCCFGELCIKGESRMPGTQEWEVGDWWEQDIAGAISSDGMEDFADKLFAAEKEGTSVRMDFECETRDGLYDRDQLFAVWEPEDVRQLIARLQSTLET